MTMDDERDARPRSSRGPESTRSSLLSAAAGLFAARGFDGTTVEAIARRSRANKAAISYHFGGKAGIYEEILASTFAHAAGEVQAILDEGLPAGETLGRFAMAFVRLVAERPHFPAIMLREAMSGGRHMTDRVLPHFVGVFQRVRGIVQRGIAEGEFRPVDPVLTHLALMGSLLFFPATGPMRERLARDGKIRVPEFLDAETYVRNLHSLLLDGLRAEPASPVARPQPR